MDKRKLGLEIIAAMKANCYDVPIEDGREMTLDVVNLTGEYSGTDMNNPAARKFVEHERKRLYDQADFVGGHALQIISKETNERLLYTIKNSKRLVEKKHLNREAWAYVMDLCGVGSTKAHEICEELGIDPDMKAKEI